MNQPDTSNSLLFTGMTAEEVHASIEARQALGKVLHSVIADEHQARPWPRRIKASRAIGQNTSLTNGIEES